MRIVSGLIGGAACAALLSMPLTVSADPRDQDRWDKKYQEDQYLFGKEAIPFLATYVHLLPKGRALDLAMGEPGRRAGVLKLEPRAPGSRLSVIRAGSIVCEGRGMLRRCMPEQVTEAHRRSVEERT